MLANTYRFHGRRSISSLLQRGKTLRRQAVSLKFVYNTHRSAPRVAVVIGRKISKSAPVRNRIRRRIFEIVRRSFTLLPPNIDIAFFVYDPALATMPADELEQLIVDLLQQAAQG